MKYNFKTKRIILKEFTYISISIWHQDKVHNWVKFYKSRKQLFNDEALAIRTEGFIIESKVNKLITRFPLCTLV